ncbi:MAG: hypothetical protein IPP36_12750 [Nitrosomonadales bacterium]|nr:hypothetical protein [Nitrosomonadales bacterium]
MAHKNWLLVAAFALLWLVPFLPSWAASVVEPGPFSVVPREGLFLEFVIPPPLDFYPDTYTRLFTQTENLPPTAQGDFPKRSSVRFVNILPPPSPLLSDFVLSAFGFDLRSSSGIEPRVHFENLFSSFKGFHSDTVTTVISEYYPSGPFLPNILSEKGTISAPGVPSCNVSLSIVPPLLGWSPPPMVPCYTISEGVQRATTVTGFEFEEFVVSGLNGLSAGLGIGYELGVTGYFDVIKLRDLPAPKRAGTVIEFRNIQDFPNHQAVIFSTQAIRRKRHFLIPAVRVTLFARVSRSTQAVSCVPVASMAASRPGQTHTFSRWAMPIARR